MLTNILMVFNLAVKNVFSNWGKNKTIVTILAVSLILIQFLISLSEGFGLQVKTFALDSLVGDLKIINPKSRVDSSIKLNFVIDDSTLDKISKIEGVRGVTTRINIPLVIKSEREFKNVVLVGINKEREKDISFLGKAYNPNNFGNTFKNNGLLIGEDLLKKLKTKNHFKVVASGQDVNEKLIEKAFFINDVFTTNIPNVSELYIFSDIKEVAKTFGFKQNEVSEVSIALVNQKYMESVKAEIKKILPKNSEIFEWGELMKFLKEWLDMMFINLLVFFSVVFLAASFPLSNTLLISVLERVYQFGILQALGLKKPYIAILILFEAIIILTIGSVIGLVIGVLLTMVLNHVGIDVSAFSQGLSGIGISDHLYPVLNLMTTIKVTLLLFVIATVISLYPAIKASLYSPIKALSKKLN